MKPLAFAILLSALTTPRGFNRRTPAVTVCIASGMLRRLPRL